MSSVFVKKNNSYADINKITKNGIIVIEMKMDMRTEDLRKLKVNYITSNGEGLFRRAEDSARDLLQGNLSHEHPYDFIVRIGNHKFLENCVEFGECYNVYYRVRDMGICKDMMIMYMMALIFKINPSVPYEVTFEFENPQDKFFINESAKQITRIMRKTVPLNQINL